MMAIILTVIIFTSVSSKEKLGLNNGYTHEEQAS